MTEISYEKLLDKISRTSGLEKEEIERRIEAKRAKLSGLISKEGAAQVVASELGFAFDKEKIKIDELVSGMRKANTIAKIIKIFPPRTFSKNGKEGKVANMIVADETSNIKVVLWDVNHIELIEKGEIGEEKTVEIVNATMRGNELHLGSFSELKLSKEELNEVKRDKAFREKEISEFKLSDNASTRAFIVQVFEMKEFNVCPECRKKVVLEGDQYLCVEHGKVSPEKRNLMNVVIDDGTETMRTVMFHDVLQSLAHSKEDLLGKEMIFSGDVRLNKFFNTPEFIVESVKEPDVDEVLKSLEEKE
jgi:ssDNA-binding replication factor A large subunit